MKKSLLFASVLLMGALSSCNNESEMKVTDPDALQPISLNMGEPVFTVRGTGTVGDVTGGDNEWAGEELYLMMLKRDAENAWSYSAWKKVGAEGEEEEVQNFPNTKVYAPTTGATGSITWDNDGAGETEADKYYPKDGSAHDFFAYRIDDAAANADWTTTDLTVEDVKDDVETDKVVAKKVYFEIDGTQDLMVGKAATTNPYDFSAKSAREGIIPDIVMEHLLTRFTFEVKSSSEINNFKVTSIEVASPTKGSMIVAYRDEKPEDMIEFPATTGEDVANLAYLPLKTRTGANQVMTELTEQTLTTTPTAIGHALLVAPGQNEYALKVAVKQTLASNAETPTIVEGKIKLGTPDTPFVAGTSYKVTIELNGLKLVEVKVTPTAWKDGEPIEINPEDDLYNQQ